jgi:hypothetical protein
MKQLCVFLVAALPLCATVLEVGPISLSGYGILTHPDFASYGGEGFGGYGVEIHASGTNGGDMVSINMRDIEIANFMGLSFSAVVTQCAVGLTTFSDYCGVVIDGIRGFGAFSGIGSGAGLLQVYTMPNGGPFNFPGPLLAEAQVYSSAQVTSVVPIGTNGNFVENFDIVVPPINDTNAPEPSAFALGLIGLAYGATKILGGPLSAVCRQ